MVISLQCDLITNLTVWNLGTTPLAKLRVTRNLIHHWISSDYENVTDAVCTLNCSNFVIMGLGLRCVNENPTRII